MVSQLGNIHCVTFGSPRVGDKEFTRLFNATVADIDSKEYFSYRFTTEDDPVPQGMVQMIWAEMGIFATHSDSVPDLQEILNV